MTEAPLTCDACWASEPRDEVRTLTDVEAARLGWDQGARLCALCVAMRRIELGGDDVPHMACLAFHGEQRELPLEESPSERSDRLADEDEVRETSDRLFAESKRSRGEV